ncbi:MAG TPA: signal peptidase II [Vicinamibacterales bacterium]|nr:signal peptidase II [Vicinamibacterales bacterium]
MNTFRRGVLLCLLLTATAGCDRVTKHFAMTTLAGNPGYSYLGDTVRLDYHENAGGFLSAGAQWAPGTRAFVFQFANGVFLAVTLLFAMRFKWSRLAGAGLILFVAGGLSNLIDRIALGSVIDFMNVGVGSLRTGIFNVADVAIMLGVALLIADRMKPRPKLAATANRSDAV